MTYDEAIQKCSNMYQSTYGIKTVEEMTRNYNAFKQYQADVAAHFKVNLKQVEHDSSEAWTQKYYGKQ